MSIYRTNNPMEYALVDGIVIDERAPDPAVRAGGTGIAIVVGHFEKGPINVLREISSQQNLAQIFGANTAYPGYLSLVNKRFSRLKVIRILATGAMNAQLVAQGNSADAIRVTAKNPGIYGNSIRVLIEDGTEANTKKYTFSVFVNNLDTEVEVFDNIKIAEINAITFEASNLVNVAVLLDTDEPDNQAVTVLTGGADGTPADGDYQTAIAVAEAEDAGNVLFLDEYTEPRNLLLKNHAGITRDKICIMAGEENQTVQEAVMAVETLRDTDGRLVYAFNWIQTLVNVVPRFVNPASFLASIISQTGAHIDPAAASNTQFLFGIVAVKQDLRRADFIALLNAGISSFEFDNDIGFKLKSGITTQIADSGKVTILRRRMTDFLTTTAGRFLKIYQNEPNTAANRTAVGAAITDFVRTQVALGVLPGDAEVQGGRASIIDTRSLNTDESIGQNRFFIRWQQRIYSSMRFIVLIGEIGQTVVVTPADELA